MDLFKCLAVLAVLFVEDSESGGHGEKHHDHVKLHLPEFIHHDHHTKVITVHHHHKKPKKEHHHHHHHHHHKPTHHHGHHHHHHHAKKSHTTHTEHHGHHGHHGNHGHHGHHGHHKHHDHHGHGHHHHDTPSYNYDPSPSVSSFEDDFGSSFTPSVPSFGGGVPKIPQVHGITQTVKQTKVYDSLPGALPSNHGNSHGYEVTEEGSEDDDDAFTSVQQAFPGTYGYLRGAAAEPSHDPFAEFTPQSSISANNNVFAAAPSLPANTFTSAHQSSDQFAPTQDAVFPNVQSEPVIPYQSDAGFDAPASSFAGNDIQGTSFIAEDNGINDNEIPVTFDREAGIQQSVNTGAVENVVY